MVMCGSGINGEGRTQKKNSVGERTKVLKKLIMKLQEKEREAFFSFSLLCGQPRFRGKMTQNLKLNEKQFFLVLVRCEFIHRLWEPPTHCDSKVQYILEALLVILYAICSLFDVQCLMLCVLCFMLYILCLIQKFARHSIFDD